MKRLISVLLTIVIVFSSYTVVFAEEKTETTLDGVNVIYKNFFIVDEWYQAEYHLVNDEIVYAKIVGNEYTAERINDEVYLNGEKTLSMHEAGMLLDTEGVKSNSIEPRSGWIEVEECPYGDEDDYTNKISERARDIDAEQDLYSFTIEALAIVLIAYYPMSEFCVTVAKDILNVVIGTAYERYEYIHFIETVKSHNVLGHCFRKVELAYYLDENHNHYKFTEVFYKTWA